MKYDLLDQTPAPAGWFVYYLNADKHEVWSLPIAFWALVEHHDDTIEYRPFVVGRLGQVVDFHANVDPVLCVLPPGLDHRPYVIALLPEERREEVTITN